ncbi:MAG: Arc family DNA binding domain-containing protein [Bacteroidetes bacterium HGW-Bacteroidetes-15]|nr:MAG: Arc family DNA binding domain-containing protein [Bacteroidetes bacterium HGW-Bacteroidetes-15]
MSKKKSFVLRIDPDKLEALERWSADEFRSINGQIEWIIDQALKKAGRAKTSKNKTVEDNSNTEDL